MSQMFTADIYCTAGGGEGDAHPISAQNCSSLPYSPVQYTVVMHSILILFSNTATVSETAMRYYCSEHHLHSSSGDYES